MGYFSVCKICQIANDCTVFMGDLVCDDCKLDCEQDFEKDDDEIWSEP